MTLSELNDKLTISLKNYVNLSKHNDTGKLYNSIKFKCTDRKGDLDIKFDAMEYIHYLDNGNFIDKFFSMDSTLELIAEYISSNLEF